MIIPTLIENRSTVQNNAPRCISSQDPHNNNSDNMNDFSLVRIVWEKEVSTCCRERVAKEFEVILKAMKMDSASRNTYLLFVCQLPGLIDDGYSGKNISACWRDSGLHPLNLNVILGPNPSFQELHSDMKDSVAQAWWKLTRYAARNRRIPHKAMHSALDPILNDSTISLLTEDTRNYETCPLNYNRAVWITCPAILQMVHSL